MRVAVLRDPPRAAVSPARDGIGSGSAAGRADLGAIGQCAARDASGRTSWTGHLYPSRSTIIRTGRLMRGAIQ